MATDTAPRPARRMYWQLPVFALGVTAAVFAWRYFPPKPANLPPGNTGTPGPVQFK